MDELSMMTELQINKEFLTHNFRVFKFSHLIINLFTCIINAYCSKSIPL